MATRDGAWASPPRLAWGSGDENVTSGTRAALRGTDEGPGADDVVISLAVVVVVAVAVGAARAAPGLGLPAPPSGDADDDDLAPVGDESAARGADALCTLSTSVGGRLLGITVERDRESEIES